MSDKIISLCYVSKRNDKSTELCRIADLVNGDFVQYTYNTGTDFYDTNRDLIYGSSVMLQAELDSIGVFEWSAYLNASNEWRTETSKAVDASWCEVIYTKHETIEQLVQTLKNGYPISNYDRLHDIILCCSPVENRCEAIYISKANAVYREGRLCIIDSVATLPRDMLDTRYATGECKCRYSPYDTRRYLARKDACHVVGTVKIKSRDEIIGEIIRQNITKEGLGRKERQAARTALEKLAMPSIIDIVSTRLQCSIEQATKYTEDCIAEIRLKLDSTVSQRLIELLIENNADSALCMRAAIQKEWDETQKAQIITAQQREVEMEAALDDLRKQIADAETALQSMQAQQEEAESKAEDALKLQKQIEAEIKKRLEGFKNDYAAALVDNAAIEAAITPFHQRQSEIMTGSPHESWSITRPENSTDTGSLEENVAVAIENWEEICVDQDMANGLTLLSFAAYARRQPLLVVGEGAISIVDLISSSVCGQPAIKIIASGVQPEYQSVVDEIEKSPKAVVCLIDGLKSGYDHIRELMRRCPQRMYVVTEMHAESLTLEPISLFNVFLPVFSDYFYTGKQVRELPTYDCSNELHTQIAQVATKSVKEAKAAISKWLDEGFYPPVVKERYANLLAAMITLTQYFGISTNRVIAIAIEFMLAPLLKCMKKDNSLKTHLEECIDFDADRKASLIGFIGMEW